MEPQPNCRCACSTKRMEPQPDSRCKPDTCPLKRKDLENLDEDDRYEPYQPFQPYSINGPNNQIDGETYHDANDEFGQDQEGLGGFGGPYESRGFSSNNPSEYRNELSDLAKRSNALLEKYKAEKAMICRQCQIEASTVPQKTNVVLKAYVTSHPDQDSSKYGAKIKPVTIEIPLDVELLSPQTAARDFPAQRPTQRPTAEGPSESFKSVKTDSYGGTSPFPDDYFVDADDGYYNPSEGYGGASKNTYGVESVPYDNGSEPLSSIYRSESSSMAPKKSDYCSCSDKECQCHPLSEGSTISIDSIGIQTEFSEKLSKASSEVEVSKPREEPIKPVGPVDPVEEGARKRREAQEAEEEEELHKIKEIEGKEYIGDKKVSAQRKEANDDALYPADSIDESEDHDDGDVLRGIPPEKRKTPFVLARPQHKFLNDICTRCMFDPSPLVDEDGKVFCPGDCGCCLCPWIRKQKTPDTYERLRNRKVTTCRCKEKVGVFTDFDEISHCSNVSYADYCPCRTRAEAKFLELYGFDMHDEEEKKRRKVLNTAVTASEIGKVHQKRPASIYS